MDFSFDEEQVALREALRDLLTAQYASIEDRRIATKSELGYSSETWAQFAEFGVLALPFSEEAGGLGAGPVEVGIVAEEMGRVLAPEPFIEAVVLAGGLIADLGSDAQREELIGSLATGELLPIFAAHEPGARWSPEAEAVAAREENGTWLLDGVKEPVIFGAEADILIVSAKAPLGTGLFIVRADASGLSRHGYTTHDGGRAAVVRFDGVVAEPLGSVSEDRTPAIERGWNRARVAYGHEALGAMEFLTTATNEYLKTRRQFGVTLNSFQALTFRAADLYVAQELTRSTVTWATAVLDAADAGDTVVDPQEATAHALLRVSKAARLIGPEAIQLHGGIGVTAEFSVGHYASRLIAIERLAGDGHYHRGRIVRSLSNHESLEPTG